MAVASLTLRSNKVSPVPCSQGDEESTNVPPDRQQAQPSSSDGSLSPQNKVSAKETGAPKKEIKQSKANSK